MDAERVRFRDVLAITEFRALYVAQTLSVIGDQFARIAVASIVFVRTGSALLTGVSYAISYLPWVIGGPLLSIAADHYQRRSVMIACDLTRSTLLLLVTLSAPTTWVLLVLMAGVTLFEPPFAASRAALIPEVVGKGEYPTAAALGNTTNQLCVVIGFALGGITTSVLGARDTILIDAATFTLSASIATRWLRRRPIATCARRSWAEEIRLGANIVGNDPRLLWLVSVSCTVVAAVIGTEAMAIPYARTLGGGPLCAGMLTAALPAGTTVGALILSRAVPTHITERALPILAYAAPLTLCITGFGPPPVIAGLIWFGAGAFSAMTVIANRVFVERVPAEVRGRAFGFAGAGIATAQGLGTLSIGFLTHAFSPAASVAILAAGTFCMTVLITVGSAGTTEGGEQVPVPAPRLINVATELSPSRSMPAS